MSIRVFFGAAFQLRFSYVSAHSKFYFYFLFWGPKISAFLKVKLLVKPFFFVFQLRFSKNGVLTL